MGDCCFHGHCDHELLHVMILACSRAATLQLTLQLLLNVTRSFIPSGALCVGQKASASMTACPQGKGKRSRRKKKSASAASAAADNSHMLTATVQRGMAAAAGEPDAGSAACAAAQQLQADRSIDDSGAMTAATPAAPPADEQAADADALAAELLTDHLHTAAVSISVPCLLHSLTTQLHPNTTHSRHTLCFP